MNKILVVSRKVIALNQGQPEEKELLDSTKVISISTSNFSGTRRDTEPPFSKENWNHPNLLTLVFDDIENEEGGREYGNNLVLMSEDHAEKIADFIRKIPAGMSLVVHCTAGISRSGAVGEIANEFLNGPETYGEFIKNNPQIIPNNHVRNLLRDALGLSYCSRCVAANCI